MILRYQVKSSVAEGAASGSDGDFSEQVLDKFDQWTFIPESYVDSVFGQSDLDSEGIYYKKNSSLYVLKPLHTDIEKWKLRQNPDLIYLEKLEENVFLIENS